MKNNTTIKSLIGFSQEEMAMLLCITRSQWAMHETGKRDLPLAAMKQLGTILTHLKNKKEPSHESQKFLALEQTKTQEWLKKEQYNIKYKKMLLDKQLHAMEHKRAECLAALDVVSFLEIQPSCSPDLLKIIKLRAMNTLSKNSLSKVLELQIKKEQLEVLTKSLEEKITPVIPSREQSF